MAASSTLTAMFDETFWHEKVVREGARALLGDFLERLERSHIDRMPYAWAESAAKDYGIEQIDRQQTVRAILDAWLMTEAADSIVIGQIVPAIREAHPTSLGTWPDERLAGLWRSSHESAMRYAARAPHMLSQATRAPQSAGMRAADLQRHLATHFGTAVVDGLTAAGRLTIVDGLADIPAQVLDGIGESERSQMTAVTTADRNIYLVASRIEPEAAAGIFLHEVGEHAGLEAMLGDDYARICAQFDRLLRAGDPYARWASQRVPTSTPIQHIDSERIAYLVERVATDAEAVPGGEGGHALGSQALSQLRTWLFRTPTCRWLDQAGLLSDFNLSPQDMTALAREAVTYVAAEAGITPPSSGAVANTLSQSTLDEAFLATPQQRQALLAELPPADAISYLYCLAALDAPMIGDTLDHWRETLHQQRTAGSEQERAIATAVLDEARRIDASAQILMSQQIHGAAGWRQSAGQGADDLYVLTHSGAFSSGYQLAQYRQGLIAVAEIDNLAEVSSVVLGNAQPIPADELEWAVRADTAESAELRAAFGERSHQAIIAGDATRAREQMSAHLASLLNKASAEADELRRRIARARSLPAGGNRHASSTQSALAASLRLQKEIQAWSFPADDQIKGQHQHLGPAVAQLLAGLADVNPQSTFAELLDQAATAPRPEAIFSVLEKSGIRGISFDGEMHLVDASSRRIAQQLRSRASNRFHLAYHGTRHTVDRFSSQYIGTGEGAQAFGYGLYFASTKMVARSYQTQHHQSSVWFEDRYYPNSNEMSATVATAMTERYPELAADPDFAPLMRRLALLAVNDPGKARDVVLANAPLHLKPAGRDLLDGVMRASRDQLDRCFIMPATGARGLKAIMESDDRRLARGLHELECCIFWRARPDMHSDQLQSILGEQIELLLDTRDTREQLEELDRELEQRPDDEFLQARKRDLEWGLESSAAVAALVDACPDLQVKKPLGVGHLYVVDIDIDEQEYLNYDRPVSAQSGLVKAALTRLEASTSIPERIRENLIACRQSDAPGSAILAALAGRDSSLIASTVEDEHRASMWLLEEGVQGIQYADGFSRSGDQVSSNFVVFSEDRISILGKTDKVISSESDEIPYHDTAKAKPAEHSKPLRFG